jgi:hypothetical protein
MNFCSHTYLIGRSLTSAVLLQLSLLRNGAHVLLARLKNDFQTLVGGLALSSSKNREN